MATVFGLNYYVFCILVLLIVLYFTKNVRDEGFFVSPGTIDQLSSTSVPSVNAIVDTLIEAKVMQKGLKELTESGYKEMFEDEDKEKEKKDENSIFNDLYKSIDSFH